uniref:Endonuclease/exonuclease/phosphatase domain-containing protein n=1 Tax=Acrobeloides nanus TaxID=290746 RepID=A0A914C8V1_9BILA
MTFNTWCSGDKVKNGRDKIARHINAVNPDVVALQEVYDSQTADDFVKRLGEPWKAFYGSGKYSDNVLLTRHQFTDTFGETTMPFQWDTTSGVRNSSVGATIKLNNGQKIVVWNLHTDWRSYGPYAMRELLNCNKETVYDCEAKNSARVNEIRNMIENEFFRKSVDKSSHIPVIVCGDFNAPSHLDYIESTKLLHNNWTFEWPTSKLLTDIGITWSTVCKLYENTTEPEPQDRIDFIYYLGANIDAIESKLYAGIEKIETSPNHEENDWPSDHFAVISDFVIGSFN